MFPNDQLFNELLFNLLNYIMNYELNEVKTNRLHLYNSVNSDYNHFN